MAGLKIWLPNIAILVLVVLYAINLCCAAKMDGIYWDMWVTITTATIGASLPVWLVWKLTEDENRRKEKEKLRDALMLEYAIALNNLSEISIIYEHLSKQTFPAPLLLPKFKEQNFQTLIRIAPFFALQNTKNLKDGIVSFVFLTQKQISLFLAKCEDLNKLFSTHPHYQTAGSMESYKKMKKQIMLLLDSIIINQGRILYCIILYLDKIYSLKLQEEAADLDPFKLFLEKYHPKQKNEEPKSHVSTEKLSK